MTLLFRHRIQNSSPGGLRPVTLSLGHGGSSPDKGFGECVVFSGNLFSLVFQPV